MEEFEKKLHNLIKNEFNLNIFGPNGCGKTTTIRKMLNFRLLSINPFFVKLHHFVNLNEFFTSLQDYIRTCISNITNMSNKNDKIFNIHNWNEFCELMDYFKELKFSFYLILDEILDIETFLFFKKQISKLLAINRAYPHFKILLISNFDMKKSELTYYFDFSVIISVPFPSLTKNDIKKIIDEHCNNLTYNPQNYSSIVNECIENFYYAFMNLNEYIYNIKKNLETFKNYNNITNEFKELKLEDNNNNDNNKNNSSKNNFESNLKKCIKEEINYAPIHLIKINSLNNNQNSDNLNTENALLETGKNLTESLSTSQKILLLSSFLATEISTSSDYSTFSHNREGKSKRKKMKLGKGFSLKSKMSHPFNYHRLVAIYQSLNSIIYHDQDIDLNMDLELSSDIGTLASLNLIRPLRSADMNYMNRKYLSGIGIDFAQKIADDFNIHLEDFIKYEKNY